MLKNISDVREARDILLTVLTTSGTLAGIGLAMVGLIGLRDAKNIQTIADDLFLFSALGFIVVCYLVFFAMRRMKGDLGVFAIAIDVVFLISLMLLIVAGIILVYSIF